MADPLTTRALLAEVSPKRYEQFPDWEVFYTPVTMGTNPYWALRWRKILLCKRVSAYLDPSAWVCMLRSSCCGAGFGNDLEGGAYCVHCNGSTPYPASAAVRVGEDGVPRGSLPHEWFDPYVDPLEAELLAEEVQRLAVHAEAELLRLRKS